MDDRHLYHEADDPPEDQSVRCRFCRAPCQRLVTIRPCLEDGSYRRKGYLNQARHIMRCKSCGASAVFMESASGKNWYQVTGQDGAYCAPEFTVDVADQGEGR